MSKTYYVYILKCADKTYYTGITSKLDKRLKEHQSAIHKTSYTAQRLPVKLEWYALFSEPEKAIQFEKRIKKWSRAKKQALIAGVYDDLIGLGKKKFND
jgi:putative endonuclease